MSSVRTKVEQKDPFTGTQTSHPAQRRVVAKGKKREYEAVTSTSVTSTSNYQSVVKWPKTFGVSPQRLMDSFFQAMREIIENKTRPIIDKPSKLDVLKKALLSVKRLPLGIITTAEKICQCARDELKNHLEHHGTKQNFQYFQEYVKDHFDAIVVSL
ncbi:Rab GTPase ypt31 [Mucor velutinosus]|uniref:Rab GTPase ypt31 n=1 Tax=Mucor velutinosus TaxID=708070 RepID=A0AAN7D432_9FUNG|nr:Rab GTPase ypt31 [Mucor velutinosus]